MLRYEVEVPVGKRYAGVTGVAPVMDASPISGVTASGNYFAELHVEFDRSRPGPQVGLGAPPPLTHIIHFDSLDLLVSKLDFSFLKISRFFFRCQLTHLLY